MTPANQCCVNANYFAKLRTGQRTGPCACLVRSDHGPCFRMMEFKRAPIPRVDTQCQVSCIRHEVPDDQWSNSPERPCIPTIRYDPFLARISSSNFDAVRVVGLKISKRVARIVRRRGKAKASTPPSNAPQTSRVVHESTPFRKITSSKPEVGSQPQSTHRLPYEIVEIIITYITSDLKTLKACSLTCRSWYTAAAAHIHHTFFLKERRPGIPCHEFEPLSKLYELGLMPLVRELRIRQWNRPWFLHQGLFPTNLRYFTAFSNVQTLRIHALDIDRFMPNIERYFGRLFPTVRSIALHWPTCTPRQLSFFLSLFSNLHDIEIWWDTEFPPDRPINKTLPPASFVPPTRKPRGRLEFREFQDFDGWKDLIASCRGLQFRYIELYKVGSYAPILSEACVDTLETFRFYLDWSPAGKLFCTGSGSFTDLS